MTEARKNFLSFFPGFGRRSDASDADQVPDEQQEQLLLLFEKRNELKREFARTLDELEALKSEHARVSEQLERDSVRLEGLEKVLSDPAECQNAIVYYRLDALWKTCSQQLEKRRTDLVQKYEELERTKLLEDFKAHAEQQQKQLEEKFRLVDEAYQEKADALAALQTRLVKSRMPWHFFRRKRLEAEILSAEEDMAPAISQREECLAELERVRDREPPAWKGLGVQSMREINLQLIAMAQYLVVHFSENDIASLARSTQLKHPGEWHYGNNEECTRLLRPIRDIVAKLRSDDRRAERLQRRVKHLRDTVSYDGNGSVVPEADRLSRIEQSPGATESLDSIHADIPVNVLESDYWGLDQLLVRPPRKKKPLAKPPPESSEPEKE